MNNLKKQLNKETLHEKDSKSDLSVIKVQFDKFLHSEELRPSNYDGRHHFINKRFRKESSGIVPEKGNAHSSKNDCSKTGNDQSSENQSSTSGNESSRSENECSERSNYGDDMDIRPSYDT
ncbi:hypothetical protein Tco_1198738 [Tanacetum coccineum]